MEIIAEIGGDDNKNTAIARILLKTVEDYTFVCYNMKHILSKYNYLRCIMAASYKKLFKLLIDRDMKKKELAEKAGISIATITKMGKDGAVVSSEILVKICSALGCTVDEIMDIVPTKEG